jgi:hypothetical protein
LVKKKDNYKYTITAPILYPTVFQRRRKQLQDEWQIRFIRHIHPFK